MPRPSKTVLTPAPVPIDDWASDAVRNLPALVPMQNVAEVLQQSRRNVRRGTTPGTRKHRRRAAVARRMADKQTVFKGVWQ
jgi:hypothetical protein